MNPYFTTAYLNLATLYQDSARFEEMKNVYRDLLPYAQETDDQELVRLIMSKIS